MAHPLHSTSIVRDATGTRFDKCRRAASQRGFTLVELAVVVVIVGILAMLAVVAYRKLITQSHTAEATNMVNAIKVAQEAYHAETQQYANINNSLADTYPSAAPGRFKTAWGAACNNCPNAVKWPDLPVHVDGPVEFGYATMAGAAGTAPPASIQVNGQTVAFPTKSPTDWFVIHAFGDTEGAGISPGTWAQGAHVYGTSWTTDLFVQDQ